MSSEESKFAEEKACFAEFVQLRGLQVIEGSLRKGDVKLREPDVLCEIVGEGAMAYEITKATSPDFEREIKRVPEKEGGVAACWGGDSFAKTLRAKVLRKSYAVSCPIELIFCEGISAFPHRIIREMLEHELGILSERGPFRRIWLLADGEVSEIIGFETYRADRGGR